MTYGQFFLTVLVHFQVVSDNNEESHQQEDFVKCGTCRYSGPISAKAVEHPSLQTKPLLQSAVPVCSKPRITVSNYLVVGK